MPQADQPLSPSVAKPPAKAVATTPTQPGEARESAATARPLDAPKTSGLHFHLTVPGWILLGLAVLVVLSVRRAYMRTTRRIGAPRLLILGLLRTLAFGVLMICLTRPVLVKTHQLHERGIGFIALDSSTSMDLRDTAGGRTRWETAAGLIRKNAAEIQALSSLCEVERLLFDSAVRKTAVLPGESAPAGSGPAEYKPAGLSTDLTALLEAFVSDAGGMTSAGAVLISDGRHNSPKDIIPAAMALARAGVPLYVIGVGQEATPATYKDVRIRQLVVPEKAFVKSRMILRIEIESSLPGQAVAPLTVEIAGKKVYERQIVFQPGNNRQKEAIEIPFVPEAIGVHRVTATVGTVADEADINNNVRHAFFRVYRSKLGIWYVEGAMRKEFGALRSALETAPNVRFNAINAYKARVGGERDLLPTGADDLNSFKLLIIGDLPADRFNREQLAAVAEFVENGGSVLMIGGISNYGAGRWHMSPLAPVFPAEMTPHDGMREGPLKISAAPEESDHPVLALSDVWAESSAIWNLLPPLPGVNKVRFTRPAARVLLSAGDSPLLMVQEYGKGRSALFTADMTWQWILKSNQGEAHKKFWRNLATWLTRSDYRDTDKAVFADSERLQYQTGEESVFGTLVHEIEKVGNAIKEARITISLTRLQGELESPVFKEEAGKGAGHYEKRFTLGTPGSYRFRAAAIGADGVVIDADSVDVQVTSPDVEHDNPKANLGLLRGIANLSGGTYFDPAQAGDAFKALAKRQAGYSKSITEVHDLWNTPWVLGLFIGLLTIEWALRKKWGLV